MKLFGRNKKAEEKVEETISEKLIENKASSVVESGELVLNIEGIDAKPAQETDQTLRGATKTLPDKQQIEEAMSEAEENIEETVGAAIRESLEAAKAAVSAAADPVTAAKSALDGEGSCPDPEAESKTEPEPEAELEPAPEAEAAAEAEPAAEKESAPETEPAAEQEPAAETEPEAGQEPAANEEPAPEQAPDAKLSSVSYASVAQAMVNAKKEPTGRFERDAVDDETLLAELYALIGDSNPKKSGVPVEKEDNAQIQTRPAPRPAVRITPETLQQAPAEYVEVEEDTSGVPGWLKGVFILLISLLLSAMTFYAVASDVIGKIF